MKKISNTYFSISLLQQRSNEYILWVHTPCGLAGGYQLRGGRRCLYIQASILKMGGGGIMLNRERPYTHRSVTLKTILHTFLHRENAKCYAASFLATREVCATIFQYGCRVHTCDNINVPLTFWITVPKRGHQFRCIYL
jgi:hypothetical protein